MLIKVKHQCYLFEKLRYPIAKERRKDIKIDMQTHMSKIKRQTTQYKPQNKSNKNVQNESYLK